MLRSSWPLSYMKNGPQAGAIVLSVRATAGDMQSGTDRRILAGDMQSGSDARRTQDTV